MIQINLLPEELKVKTKKTPGGQNLDVLFYLFPAVVAVIILVHLVLAGVQISRVSRAGVLFRRLAAMEPQRKQLEARRLAETDPVKMAINDFEAQNILWSFKLDRISRYLPPGVWFTEVAISKTQLVIRGTVVALEEDEMGAINAYMSSLRNDNDFMNGFVSIDLGPLGTKTIGSYSVINFILTVPVLGNVKGK